MRKHNLALGYLHAFIVMLVVAHHSFQAYIVNARPHLAAFSMPPYRWGSFPLVDSQRWLGFDVFCLFNDQFFMPLLFLISGLFVWSSITQKGNREFLRGRILRLGLPFIIVSIVITPLAYYPSYRITGADQGLLAFYQQWLALDGRPSGPVWFLSILLFFDALVVILRKLLPDWGDVLGKKISWTFQQPILFFCLLVMVSAIVYLPMQILFGKYNWTGLGPIRFQTSRIILYAVYFFAGVSLGSYGLNQGLLASEGRLARRWPFWLMASLMLFMITTVAFVKSMSPVRLPVWDVVYAASFVLFCASCGLFYLALFVRVVNKRRGMFDRLRENAFGIYLIHYLFVVWLQYALLNVKLAAIGKGVIVFVGALVLSFSITVALRRINAVSRMISPADSHARA